MLFMEKDIFIFFIVHNSIGLLINGDINEKHNTRVCRHSNPCNVHEVFFLNLMMNRKYSFDSVTL